MGDVRVILILGRTGNGKSTLANVITNSNKFEESAGVVSIPKDYQEERVTYFGVTYSVIDTLGIGDTELTTREVLQRLAKVCLLTRGGLSQILFVTGTRIDESEKAAYALLGSLFFSNEIYKYTTIIRTRFNGFLDPKKVELDSAAIKLPCRAIFHLDNQVGNNRELSMQKIITWLPNNTNQKYEAKELDSLNVRLQSYRTPEEQKLEEKARILKIQQDLEKANQQIKEQQERTAAEQRRLYQIQQEQASEAARLYEIQQERAREAARLYKIQQEQAREAERLKQLEQKQSFRGFSCRKCKRVLMPGGGGISFTGGHTLNCAGNDSSTLQCGFCGYTNPLSQAILASMGMFIT